MENKIIEKIREFVEEECKKPTSKYGYDPYPHHFMPVVKYSKLLAEKLSANIEIVEIAAWLHDIGSIMHGRENHHITGAEIAEKKLRELGYAEEKIALVKQCILNHRGSVKNERITSEEMAVAEADAMSHFDNIGGLFMAAFVFENHNQGSAAASVKQKLKNSWEKLSPIAKEIIKPRYEAAMLLLS